MNASKGPIFLFHADANPIGGYLTHPVEYLFPPHGSSSLAQAGGQASGQLGPHRVEGIVSFESARSNVYGRKQGPEGPWTSTITSVVEKLNVLDILRADAIVTKIKINHPHVGIHPTVSFAGTHFHNLTIAGEPIHPVVDLHTFARTEEHIEKNNVRWEKDPHHLEAAKGHIKSTIEANSGLPWVEKRYGWMLNDDQRDERGHVVCSLVKAIKNGKPDPTPGHILHVPELGNIFLGEIYINHGAFRVTMLRIEMGCLAEGDMSVASGGGNGGTMPG